MSTVLTLKQRAIYDYIVDCVHREGIPPSLTEIAQAFDLTSVSGVADHLRALERKGYIRRRRGVSRGIELVDVTRRTEAVTSAVQVPVVGSLPARKVLTLQRTGGRHLMFDGRVAREGAVAIRVDLTGLESHGILRGDYVIVVRNVAADDGELALAHVRRRTTLVQVLPERRGVRCVHEEVEVTDGFELVGRVVAVLRSMDDTKEPAHS